MRFGNSLPWFFAGACMLASASAQNAGGPTKVTGKPTKLPDGLEYWDIKEGTGPAAKPQTAPVPGPG